MVLLVLTAALLVAVGVIVWLVQRHARFRGVYKWSDADLHEARRESVVRSRSVVAGKVQEHLAPIAPPFIERFNPKDARFLGSPVDFVVFDGLDEGNVRGVCFVEVKTGTTAMTRRERQVRNAINRNAVSFELVRFEAMPAHAALQVESDPPPESAPALQP